MAAALCVLIFAGGASAAPVDFSHEIVPILRRHCVACHRAGKAKGDFSLDTRERLLAGVSDPRRPLFLELIQSEDPDKRAKAVRRLLEDEIGYAEHWLSFWNDHLRNDYTGGGFISGGRNQISGWLHDSLKENKPYDRMIRELVAPESLASRGFSEGIKWRGDASAGQTVEIQFAQSVAQAFLGINLKCASCHDSFINRWKLDDACGLAAVFSKRPLEIHRCDRPQGRMAEAAWLFPEIGRIDPEAERERRLLQLAALLTHPENGRTARTIANRLWARLMGRGIVHPLNAMQTEPWSADLLDFLGVHLTDRGYDLKALLELIATSEAYGSETEILTGDPDDDGYVYRGPRGRRLSAEQFLDAVWSVTATAPATYDAPVVRWREDQAARSRAAVKGKWIWGASAADGRTPPGGETILLRRIFRLPDDVARCVAVVSCDNEFALWANDEPVGASDDWTKPLSLTLPNRFRKGLNQIVARAANSPGEDSPAGLFFEARMLLKNGSEVTIATDGDWLWNPNAPEPEEGRLEVARGGWAAATVVEPVGAWTRKISPQVVSGEMPMVRASVLNSDALMRSLGRPLREQIVTSRPSGLGTLVALELRNNERFHDSLVRGGQYLAARKWGGSDELIEHVFLHTLSRRPTSAEQAAIREILGERPGAGEIEDLLWALFLKPEFLILR